MVSLNDAFIDFLAYLDKPEDQEVFEILPEKIAPEILKKFLNHPKISDDVKLPYQTRGY